MYELFILGKLMHRPMHGYVLKSIINAAIGPFRRLSWGTLYPLLRKLEQQGFIAIKGRKSDDGRGTKAYYTTPRGKARLFELMHSRGEHDTAIRDLFRVKLSNFGHIGMKDQRLIVADYRAHLAAIVKHSEAIASEVMKAPGLAAAERPYVLKAIDHQRHLAASEIRWLDELIQNEGDKNDKQVPKTASMSGRGHRRNTGSRSGSRYRASETTRPNAGR